jgi:hypothetical protein
MLSLGDQEQRGNKEWNEVDDGHFLRRFHVNSHLFQSLEYVG